MKNMTNQKSCRPIKRFQRAKYSPDSATQSPKKIFSTDQTGMVTLVRPI